MSGAASKADPDAIREALARARDFVARHGDETDRRAVEARLDDTEVARERARAVLLATQRPDGSFGSPRATADALVRLGGLGLRRGAAVERAVGWLGESQDADGAWRGAATDDDETVLQDTGRIGAYLAGSVYARPALIDAAGRWLAARWTPERRQAAGWDELAAWAGFFANVHHDLSDEALSWCGRELERALRGGHIDAVGAARVFLRCDVAALPGSATDVVALVPRLVAEQAPDGGFGRGEVSERVAATCAALDLLAAVG